LSEAVLFDFDENGDHVPIIEHIRKTSYKPTVEFQEIVHEVVERRNSQKDKPGGLTVLVPLSEAIDNECRRHGIFQ
jgi:hypothetical protein